MGSAKLRKGSLEWRCNKHSCHAMHEVYEATGYIRVTIYDSDDELDNTVLLIYNHIWLMDSLEHG